MVREANKMNRKRFRLHLRRSREVTRVCSRKLTHQNAPIWRRARAAAWRQRELGDGLACRIQRPCAPSARMKSPASSLARGQGLFFGWVTLSEHKWVTSRERRGPTRPKTNDSRSIDVGQRVTSPRSSACRKCLTQSHRPETSICLGFAWRPSRVTARVSTVFESVTDTGSASLGRTGMLTTWR